MNSEPISYIYRQCFFWIATFSAFIGFIWLFRDILLPFIVGMALAYFLDPLADRLERIGLSRLNSAISILFFFIMFFILGLMIIVPILGNQIFEFLERIPDYTDRLQALFDKFNREWIHRFVDIESESFQNYITEMVRQGAEWLRVLLNQIWSSGRTLLDLVSLLIVTPVVAFYLLCDWDRMINKADSWLPINYRTTIRALAGDINNVISGFVRGQGILCIILGLFYGILLTIYGLNFGLLIGFFSGLISFIPYVGSLTGFILSFGVAVLQFWPEWIHIAIIVGIFAVGQFLEGNILQPKLIGDKVGLHPVWLIFSLFAFGSLFGFVGMLIAVPAAASIGVLVRFALKQYLDSSLYRGKNSP